MSQLLGVRLGQIGPGCLFMWMQEMLGALSCSENL